MKGVVLIPNDGSSLALIERDDDLLMIVEPLGDEQLKLLDTVQIGTLDDENQGRMLILSTGVKMDFLVHKMASHLTWEEKLTIAGSHPLLNSNPPSKA